MLGSTIFCNAQEESSGLDVLAESIDTSLTDSLKSDIYIYSKSSNEGLQLRWAPSNADVWLNGNKFGYNVDRILMDSTVSEVFLPLESGNFKPWPLADWEGIVSDSTPYTAAAAMTIYGNKDKSPSSNFFQADQELNNNFGFALLSADLDKNAAIASGLYAIDKDLKLNEYAIYRIYIKDELNNPLSDTSFVLLNYKDPVPFKAPVIEAVKEAEMQVTIEWNNSSESTKFTGFYIERSDDNGNSYVRLNDRPLLDISTNVMAGNFISHTDSLEQNYQPFLYRIVGLDAFGDQSLPSEAVVAMGKDRTPPEIPVDFIIEETKNNQFELSWSYKDVNDEITGFNVYRSIDNEENFEIIGNNLSSSSRKFIEEFPDPIFTNYYFVTAIDTAGNEAASIVNFGITTDETAPQAPLNLRYTIDSLGQLLLEWDKPSDQDIRGYRVYVSNASDEEFAAEPGNNIDQTFFVTKLPLETLTEDIYYFVQSIDLSYNVSENSEILRVKKPDIIAPSQSIFVDYNVSLEGIYFEWIKSTSDDVLSVDLMRKSSRGQPWNKVVAFNQDSLSFLDSNVIEGKVYEYMLRTTDDDGNVTDSEKTLNLEALKSYYLKDTPVLLTSLQDEGVLLTIQYPNAENYKFTILKAKKENVLTTYKLIEGISFLDTDIQKKTKYHYAVMATASDGRDSELSEQVMVKK